MARTYSKISPIITVSNVRIQYNLKYCCFIMPHYMIVMPTLINFKSKQVSNTVQSDSQSTTLKNLLFLLSLLSPIVQFHFSLYEFWQCFCLFMKLVATF